MPLDEDYIKKAMQDARKFQGNWDTGTSGTLAAHVARLVQERDEHRDQLRQMERELLEIRARLGIQATEPSQLPPDIPDQWLHENRHFQATRAAEAPPLSVEIEPIATSMSPEALEAVWAETKRKSAEILAGCRLEQPSEPVTTERQRPRVIGLAGRAGAGKSTVAGMIPGATVIQLADPLYQGLAAMLGIPEATLRDRAVKDRSLPGIGRAPRELLQTLGTEWGRNTVCTTFWVDLARERISRLLDAGLAVVAIADVRFANEAEMIREHGGRIWRISRDTDPIATADHSSESGIPDSLVDCEIDNSGTLDDLRRSVLAALVTNGKT